MSYSAMRSRLPLFVCGLLCLVFLDGPYVCADEPTADTTAAEKLLAEHGVETTRSGFSIKEEANLKSELSKATTLRRKMYAAGKALKKMEAKEDAATQSIRDMYKLRSRLRQELNKNLPASRHNRIVNQLNELGDRIAFLKEDEELASEVSKVRGEFNNARETYVNKLMEIREQVDKVQDVYEDLNANTEIVAAANKVAEAAKKNWKLGKSKKLAATLRTLKKMEDVVITERIKLRKGRSDTYYIVAQFNGEHTEELVLDTGASIVALPYEVAQRVGLTPSDDDPKVRLKIADGSIVEGTTVYAKSIRVGKFTVENVECAVMPREFTEASALLGMSFFKKFTYKIDSAKDELIMNKVE